MYYVKWITYAILKKIDLIYKILTRRPKPKRYILVVSNNYTRRSWSGMFCYLEDAVKTFKEYCSSNDTHCKGLIFDITKGDKPYVRLRDKPYIKIKDKRL